MRLPAILSKRFAATSVLPPGTTALFASIRAGERQIRAAELCQTPLAAFLDFAAPHGVPPLRHGANLAEERLSIDRLGV
jgi:hypothetical protein